MQNLFGDKNASDKAMDFSVQRVLGYELYFMNDLTGNISQSKIVDFRSDENFEELRQIIADYYSENEKRADIISYLKSCTRFISKNDFLNMFRIILKYPETSGDDSIIKTQVAIALNEYKKENIEEELKDILIKEPLSEGLFIFLGKVQKDYSGINRETPIIQESVYDEIIKRKVETFLKNDDIDMEKVFKLAGLATKFNDEGKSETMIEDCARHFKEYFIQNPRLMLKWFFYVETESSLKNEHDLKALNWFNLIFGGWKNFENAIEFVDEKSVGEEYKNQAKEIFNRLKENDFRYLVIDDKEVEILRQLGLLILNSYLFKPNIGQGLEIDFYQVF